MTPQVRAEDINSGAAAAGKRLKANGTGGATWDDVGHAELTGLQGGTTDEYYHLTAAEYAALGSSSGKYRQFVYLMVAGEVSFVIADGKPVMALLDLE